MSVYSETRFDMLKSRMKLLAYKRKISHDEAMELEQLTKKFAIEMEKRDAPVPKSEVNYLKFRARVAAGLLPYIEGEIPDTIQELYTKVACHLTGRDVSVRLQKPYLKGTNGVFMPKAGGGAVIDISPDMGQNKEYMTFLHEVAHCRLHYTDVKHHNVLLDYEPGSVELTSDITDGPVIANEENEAEEKAKKWDMFADVIADDKWRFGEGCSPEIPKLFTLLEMEVYTE